MKRILFLTPNLGSGGAERQMVTVVCLLKEKGYDVYVLCYSNGDFYAHILLDKDIPIIWKIENNYLKRVINIRHYIHKGGFDTVISFLETPNFLNNFSAIGGKKWNVITGERSAKQSTFLSRRGKIFGLFQRYADNIVCNSENAKNMWLKYYPQYQNKLTTIYNTVTLGNIDTTYQIRRDGKLHIIVAASYQYLKNPINVVKAIASMTQEEREKIELSWYGRQDVSGSGTSAYDKAMQIIKENNLQNSVCFNEATKNIANKMNEADVVALFSSVEGLPNTICEAMTIGKPIIMTKVSDYNVLVDERNGFLCDWNDLESIKNTFLSMINLTNEELVEKGIQSQQKANKLFIDEKVVNKWIKIIER